MDQWSLPCPLGQHIALSALYAVDSMGGGGTQINKDFSHSLYKDELRVASGT